jgi:hypothetical protein
VIFGMGSPTLIMLLLLGLGNCLVSSLHGWGCHLCRGTVIWSVA